VLPKPAALLSPSEPFLPLSVVVALTIRAFFELAILLETFQIETADALFIVGAVFVIIILPVVLTFSFDKTELSIGSSVSGQVTTSKHSSVISLLTLTSASSTPGLPSHKFRMHTS
jgi:hypothetical protein